MARSTNLALGLFRNIGKRITTGKSVEYRHNVTITNIVNGAGCASNCIQIWGGSSRRSLPTQLTFLCHFTSSSSYGTSSVLSILKSKRESALIGMFVGTSFNVTQNDKNMAFHRTFSTTAQNLGRSNKFPLEKVQSQTFLGGSKHQKRRQGQLNKNIDSKKIKLKETRWKINRRMGNIRSSLLIHNKKLHEKWFDQKTKNGFVRRLRRQFNLNVKRENIKTIPNLLTTLRMASAPLLSYLVVNDYYGCALSIFVLAGFTDVLDGYIARNFKNQRTAFGTALDPLADKFLMCFLTVSLTTAGLIPMPLTVLILSRDAGLVVASFYIRYISLAPPRTLARYFDFSHVTAKIYPSNISKINTGIQLSFVACTLAAPVFDFVGSPWLQFLMYTTAATTFLSGADYVLTWRRRLKIIKNN